MKKILSTVIRTIHLFFEKNPTAILFFHGSTEERTRLYSRIIKNQKEDYDDKYLFYGYDGHKFEIFSNEKDYSEFLIKKRKQP